MRTTAKRFLQQPTSYKKRKQDLEYSAEVYHCSIHELEDPRGVSGCDRVVEGEYFR